MLKPLDTFGSGSADDDIARWEGDKYPLFFETPLIRDYLINSINYPFLSGTKGIGKSLLLFKKSLNVSKISGIILIKINNQKIFTPSIDFALRVKEAYYWQLLDKEKPQYESWVKLWESAILKSVLSSWIDYLEFNEKTYDERYKKLRKLLNSHRQYDPFETLSNYLAYFESSITKVRGKFQLPETSKYRQYVQTYHDTFPPTYLFIDNQDDYFEYNPEFWIFSGYGTFRSIFQIRQYSNHRIHIFATFRPEIIWELKKSQHFPMWESLIFNIKWKDNQLIDLFNLRAANLNHNLLQDPKLVNQNPLAAFLGSEFEKESLNKFVIRNHAVEINNPIYEKATDYILRHTLRRPRDLIIIGNSILETRKLSQSDETPNYQLIRHAVDRAASHTIAKGYLAEIRHRWPWGVSDSDPTSIEGFISRYIKKNILHIEEAKFIQQDFAKELGNLTPLPHPFCLLGAFGLIGWGKKKENGTLYQHFLLPGEETITFLPGNIEWFFVHPILFQDPFHIKFVKGFVVGPGLIANETVLKNIKPTIIEDFKIGKKIKKPPKRTCNKNNSNKLTRNICSKQILRILHLSDFHFSEKTRWDYNTVLKELILSLSELASTKEIDFIFISGDISHSGKKSEFDLAFKWLSTELLPVLQIRNENVILVPGNHDIERNKRVKAIISHLNTISKEGDSNKIAEAFEDAPTKKQIIKPFNNYLHFWKKFGPKNIDKSVPWWSNTFQIDGVKVFVAGICSSWLSGLFEDDKGKLLLSQWQINKLFENKNENDISIALMHHPWSYLKDADEHLKESIYKNSNIVMKGHQHKLKEAIIERPNKKILEIACGSCYENSKYPNSYHLLELDFKNKTATVYLRTWDGTCWITDRNRFQGAAPKGKIKFNMK